MDAFAATNKIAEAAHILISSKSSTEKEPLPFSMKNFRESFPGIYCFLQRWWAVGFILLVTSALFVLFRNSVYDDPFITYRYASNLVGGQGFVYNAGEWVLSTTTPLQVLLLAGLSFLWSDIPRLSVLIGCFSLALSSLALWDLLRASKAPIAAWVALAFFPFFPQVFLTLGGELPLYLALGLGAFACYFRRSYSWAALCATLAALARPDGLLIGLILGVHYLLIVRKPVPWKAVLIYLVIQGLWWGFAWLYFSSPLPVTLFVKQQQGLMPTSERFVPGFISMLGGYSRNKGYWLEALLALLGVLFSLRKERPTNLLLIWSGVYFLAYWLLGVSRSYWYYTPLVPGFIALLGLGVQSVVDWSRRYNSSLNIFFLRRLVIYLLVILCLAVSASYQIINLYRTWSNPDQRYLPYRQIGEWLAQNTPLDASVGTLEIGIIGYFSNRTIVDFAGLIQPQVAAQMSPNTTYADTALWAVEYYHPSYLVLHDGLFPDLEETYVFKYCQYILSFQGPIQLLEIYSCSCPGE